MECPVSVYWKSHRKEGVEKAIISTENILCTFGQQINELLVQINQKMGPDRGGMCYLQIALCIS